MPDPELAYLPATELSALIRTRQLSPVELFRATLSRIERSQGLLNAFITIAAEQALTQARAAEQAVMRRDKPGPLHSGRAAGKDLVPAPNGRPAHGPASTAGPALRTLPSLTDPPRLAGV